MENVTMVITDLRLSEVYELDGTMEALEEWMAEQNECRAVDLDAEDVEDILNRRHHQYDIEWKVG